MDKKRLLSLLMALIMVIQLVACGESGEPNESNIGEESNSETLTAGRYTSEQVGHNAAIEYEIVLSEDKILEINVISSYETPGVSDKALLTDLPEKIISDQNLSVDAVTGATFSSMATIRAVEDAIVQAGGNPDNFKKEVAKSEAQNIEETADIIIAGGGGAGLAAAVAASQEGASVIIVEKSGYIGGNTMVAGGIYNAPDPELQKNETMDPGHIALWEAAINEEPVSQDHEELQLEVKKQIEDWKASGDTSLLDTKEWFALQTWNGGDKVADLDLVKKMTYDSYDSMKWLEDLGWEYENSITTGAGSMYPRTHKEILPLGTGIIKAYTDELGVNENVKIIYNTEVTELIADGNKVVGAKAVDKDGNTYTFNANKSVILCTGGFAGNLEMVQEYNTSGKWPNLAKMKSSNLPAIKGDGIRLAKDVGADLRDMDQIQLLFTCDPKTGMVNPGNFKPKGTAGYIFVNQEGERFVKEDGRRDEICLAILEQTDEMFYMVQCADSGIDYETTTDVGGVPIKYSIENTKDLIYYGETLEEVAEAANIPFDTVKETVEAYNKLVDENATTDEFGRSLFTVKLENGPWYIVPRAPVVHHTMGGVVIDENCHVLNESGEIIEGLLAAGEVVGGIHGSNRLGGNAIVDTVVFGRTAGLEAVK